MRDITILEKSESTPTIPEHRIRILKRKGGFALKKDRRQETRGKGRQNELMALIMMSELASSLDL
jgi:hypothetical protein